MRKRSNSLLVILVVVLLLSIFTACGKMSKGAANSAKKTDQMGLPVKLDNPDIYIISDSDQSDLPDELNPVKVYEKKYNGKVTIARVANMQEKETKVIAAITAGDSCDVIPLNLQFMPRWAVKGLLEPMDDYVKQYVDLSNPLWQDVTSLNEQFKYKGKQYVLCTNNTVKVTLFNKTLFENNGIKTPIEYYREGNWNWGTLKEVGMKLTQDTNGDGVVDQWGLGGLRAELEKFAISNGAQMINISPDGIITENMKDPGVIETLQYFQDAEVNLKFHNPGNSPTAFTSGKQAMSFEWEGRLQSDDIQKVNFQWDIAPCPLGPSTKKFMTAAGGGMMGICVGAKNPQGAIAYMSVCRQLNNQSENEKLKQYLTDAQIAMLMEIRKMGVVPLSTGIGNWRKVLNDAAKQISKGVSVTTVIEQQLPKFQVEIDMMMKGE